MRGRFAFPIAGSAVTRDDARVSLGWRWIGICLAMGFLLWVAPAGAETPCGSDAVVPESQPALRSECEVLWAFYTSLDDPGILDDPDNPSAWLPTVPFSQWAGLLVVNDAVEGLILPSSGLEGLLSPQLGTLTNLVALDLGDNRLRGSIPAELAGLGGLEYLFLYNNRLSGPVPEELGSLTRLKVLELSGNELSGPIPPQLGRLAGLEGLFLHGNRFSGPLPKELGALNKLERLFLQGNRLDGAIPPEFGRLSELVTLDLSMNDLSGPVPPELGRLPKLEKLRLHGNRLSASGSAGPFSPEPLVPAPPVASEESRDSSGSGRFVDDDGSVHEENIEVIAALGVTVGCNPPENDRFCPQSLVNRAQMAVFLSRALGGGAGVDTTVGQATDVSGDAWYFGDVQRMIALGVVELPEDGTFRPLEPLTRIEMAVSLVRAFPALPEVEEPVGAFSDVPATWKEAGAVEAILDAGVTSGCSADPLSYCPDRPVTRAQMASFLVQALGTRPEDAGQAILPGSGVPVRMARAGWPSGNFQAALYRALLVELGYEVGDPADLELEPSDAYVGMAEGRVDFWVNGWYPDHDRFMDLEVGDGSRVGDYVSPVGDQMAAGGLRGFLVSRAFAEEHGIATIDDLDRNPGALVAYDETDVNPQNGLADIYGCPPSWACYDIVDSIIEFSGWENIDHVTGTYQSMHADALAKIRQGIPVIAYVWTPGSFVGVITPGREAVWIGVEHILDDSNPRGRPGGESWDQRPGQAPVRPSMCPGATEAGACRLGWRASDIRVTASNEFLRANPAAARLFELVRLDPLDVSRQIAMQSRGTDVAELASRWIAEHRGLVDIWLVQSRIAAIDPEESQPE